MKSPSDQLNDLQKSGLLRKLRVLDGAQQPAINLCGESRINFSSNDYLGLANSAHLKQVYCEAIDRYGVGSGASRLVSGTMAAHSQLEERLAAFKKTRAALTFNSGFATATGVLPAIAGKNDILILDKLCHASLIDGARLSGATMRIFPHNDIDKLASHLEWAGRKRSPDSRVIVVTESVFSMDGDRARLREICGLKQEHDALLFIDEAHAFGVIGPNGRGLVAEENLHDQVDFQMGTFSKAAGLSGGYLCADRDWIDLLINRARSFIYSTAPGPALAETVRAAIDLIDSAEGDALREDLRDRIRILDPHAESAIIPVIIGENEAALSVSEQLNEAGFLVPAIRFPTVPRGSARLRITLSSAHRKSDVTRLAEIVKSVRNDISQVAPGGS